LKKGLIFIIIFSSAAILGLVRDYLLGVGVYGPEHIVVDSPRTAKTQIQYSGGENPLLALLAKHEGENRIEEMIPDGEKQTGAFFQLLKNGKGRKEPSPSAENHILSLAGLTNKDIPRSKEELNDFLGRLEEVSTRRDTDDGSGQAKEILFSNLQPDVKTGLPEGNESFLPKSPRIYAVFSSNTDAFQDLDNVLVKWFNPLGNVDMFQYMKIIPNSNYNYIWRELDNWEPGIYNVELYGIGKEIKILASGSYFVKDSKK